MISPSTRTHVPRQYRIERDWDAPGKTYLAPMRMPAQENIELRMRCLLVDFWRVGQEN